MGTGLPHSILAWAQDCHTQSWRGHRIAPPNPAVATGLPHSILAWAQNCHTQSWRGHRIATLNPGVGTGLLHPILLWQQDCSTQSCCGNRIAPPNPAAATGLLHPILLWQQDCPGVSQKTLEAQCCTALRPQTRRPDCAENYGSALLYSRTLPEKTGCDAVNMAFLPGSPPFPASNLASNAKEMGKIKLFPTTEYSSKQASDPVVPLVPCTGIFLGPSESCKTVALISLILEQYRGVFERIYVFSPSVNIDDGWIPVKKYIEGDLGVNTEREQTYWDEWDEAALRRIIQQQRKITEASKKLEMKKLYQVLVVIDDFADTPQLHKPHGALDTLFIRGRHMQISTWVSSQKLRLISAAVRVNMQFLCCWRLRNQHELDAVIEELSALLPKEQLYRLYEQATREPYSFLFVYYLKPRNEMFYKRFEERFALEKDADGSGAQLPGPEAVRQLDADKRKM